MSEEPLTDTTEHSKNKNEVSEVVITEAMIEAGAEAFIMLGLGMDDADTVAVVVYDAMEKAKGTDVRTRAWSI